MAYYRASTGGGGVTPTPITPSDSSPASMSAGTAYEPTTAGYAIESNPTNVTPSSTPTSVSSGDMVRVGGSGVIVDSVPTPTNITPSNSSPVALSQNGLYKAQGTGYAIYSYSSKTPNDSSPPAVSSGDIIKVTSYGGYLYRTQQTGGGGAFAEKYSNLTASSSHTITSLTAGKHYLVLVYFISAANMLYNRYDGCTASGGTLTKVSNLTATAQHAVGTFYDLVPSGTSVTVSTSQYNAYCKVFND